MRLKGFQSHPADLQKIKRNIAAGKRLTTEQARLLCATYSCIIAEPEAVFKFFPMEEGLIDTLNFDEASQVSIAHSLSLILRAKQVVVFGDKYQYGAVSAVNVSRRYAIPTLVEVKRSTDTRIRREVVGQMLDYAANAVVYWPMEQIRAQFEATCQSQELEAEQVITDFLTPEANPEEFWQQMKTNLQAEKSVWCLWPIKYPPNSNVSSSSSTSRWTPPRFWRWK